MISQVTRHALPLAAVALIAGAGIASVTQAEPPKGVGAEVLARGTYDPFKVRSNPEGPIDFTAKSKSAMDLVVRRHSYNPRGSTGWHEHPGPVFVTVTKGTLTFYERGDKSCTPHVVSANPSISPHNAYVDDGHGHIAINETDQPAEDISVITSPVGGPFRNNLPVEGSPCAGF